MGKPLQLHRLPKSGRLRTIRFRRTTPGNFTRLLFPHSERSRFNVLDSSHPWAGHLPQRFASQLPSYHSTLLNARAFPKALLGFPEKVYTEESPFALAAETPYGADGRLRKGKGRTVNMSLMHVVAKKDVHKLASVRNRVKARIKSAVGLIVTRGAVVEKVGNGKREKVVCDEGEEEEEGERWVMQNWTYVFTPTLEIYRLPFPTLIRTLRDALTQLNFKARTLEKIWRLESLQPVQMHRTQQKKSPLARHTASAGAKPGVRVQLGSRDDGEGRRASRGTLTRMRNLLGPYASRTKLADEDILESEDDSSENDVGEFIVPPAPRARRTDRPLRNVQLLPPRREAKREHEVRADKPRDRDRDEDGVLEDDEKPSTDVVKAMYSRKPILKPVGLDEEDSEEKLKPRGRSRARQR